jgi:hypothetical protein
VIVRPRGLDWDLLPARWTGDPAAPPIFCQFDREEAALVARQFQQSLEKSVEVGQNPLETFGRGNGQVHQLWVRSGEYVWILCRRRPGKPYEPMVFANQEEALEAVRHIGPLLHPAPDANQEFYFNTQNFTR